jgi:hypothetical protein
MSIKDETREEDRWSKIFRRLTKDLTPKQALVYKIIFETTWNVEFTFLPTIPYDEVVIRSILKIHPHGKRLEEDLDTCGKEEYTTFIDKLSEKEGKEVKDIIDELCAKGFVSCKTIRFGDGVTEKVSEPTKILIMRDYDRRILMQAMTEEYDSFGFPSGELYN